MKVVIDTNGLLQSVPRDGSYRWLYDAFAAGEFTWVINNNHARIYGDDGVLF